MRAKIAALGTTLDKHIRFLLQNIISLVCTMLQTKYYFTPFSWKSEYVFFYLYITKIVELLIYLTTLSPRCARRIGKNWKKVHLFHGFKYSTKQPLAHSGRKDRTSDPEEMKNISFQVLLKTLFLRSYTAYSSIRFLLWEALFTLFEEGSVVQHYN